MKKVVEFVIFNKNDEKVISKILDNKLVKGLAQIKRIDELEDDYDAIDRLYEAIKEVTIEFKLDINNDVDHVIIYNDFSDYDMKKYDIDDYAIERYIEKYDLYEKYNIN